MQYLILLTLLEKTCLLHAMNNILDISSFICLSEVADLFSLTSIFFLDIIVIFSLVKRCL